MFLCIVASCFFLISPLGKGNFVVVVLDRFFLFGRQKKWLLVPLDRWLFYTVTILWEFTWADPALVIL